MELNMHTLGWPHKKLYRCLNSVHHIIICLGEPDIAHRLIVALGLGSSGHHISPGPAPAPPGIVDPGNSTDLFDRFTRSVCEEPKQVCLNITTPPSRRRGELVLFCNDCIYISQHYITSTHIRMHTCIVLWICLILNITTCLEHKHKQA